MPKTFHSLACQQMYESAEKTINLLLRSITQPRLWDIKARFMNADNREHLLTAIYDQIAALDHVLQKKPNGLKNLLLVISKLQTPMTRQVIADFKYETLEAHSMKVEVSHKIGYILGARLAEYARLANKSPDIFLNDPSEFLQTLVDCCDGHPVISSVASKPVLNAITEQSELIHKGAAYDEDDDPVGSMNQILLDIADKGIDGAINALDDSHNKDAQVRLMGCRYNLERRGLVCLIASPQHSQTSDLARMIDLLNDACIDMHDNNQMTVMLSPEAGSDDRQFVRNNLLAFSYLIQNTEVMHYELPEPALNIDVRGMPPSFTLE